MGWFFGCFGGSSKKERKHQAPVSQTPLPKPQKFSSTLPLRVPPASSSAIPIKAFPARDGPNREDLYTVRQVSSSVPVRCAQGAYFQDGPGIRMPEKERKPGPWHQLDDLEEELNDLGRQINREPQDAKKIREEVNFLKSCSSLVKSPSEQKSPQRIGCEPSSVQERRWHLWHSPSASPVARTLHEQNFQFEGLKAALCESTPAKEGHGQLPLGFQNPISSNTLTQSSLHRNLQTSVQEDFLNVKKKSDAGIPLKSPAEYQQREPTLPDPIGCHVGNNPKDRLDMSSTLPKRSAARNQQKGPPLPDPHGCYPGNSNSKGPLDMSGTQCADTAGNESFSMKKRRLAAHANPAQPPQAMRQPAEDNVSHGQDHNTLFQKRLKAASSREPIGGEMTSSLLSADPIPMHFFRCDSLSPIVETGTYNEESASSDNEAVAQGASHQLQNSYSHSSQTTSQSPSLRQSTASQAKSVTFAFTNDTEEYTTDDLLHSHDAEYSEESYTNSTCINDANEQDDSDTASYSPSIDSEETLSDLSPERCFSPPLSPSHERKSSVYRSYDSSNSSIEMQTAKNYSFVSTQYSSANGARRKQHVASYDNRREGERSEDENELYTDAMSHVSTECSDREYRKWHSRNESMDSVSAKLGHVTNEIDTPPKLSSRISTPNISIQGKHSSRIRSKPASSVLTPVENVSQWKQLKERDQKQNVYRKGGSDHSCGLDALRKVKGIPENAVENPKAMIGNENKGSSRTMSGHNGQLLASGDGPISVNTSLSHWAVASGPETVPMTVNASLSHWGTATTSRAGTIRVDASLSQWGTLPAELEPVRVETCKGQDPCR